MEDVKENTPPTEIKRFTAAEKTVTVYPAAKGSPTVFLNTYGDQGEEVRNLIRGGGISLITVTDLDWNRDMSPWNAPPAIKGDDPFSGGAEEYLKLMLGEIVPKAEEYLGEVSRRGIAGYSMAGMFALYALYKTDIFDAAACVSGSLWFPGFKDYVFSNEMKSAPKKLYFSLGDGESRTRNPYLRTVSENTRAIAAFYREKGMETVFKLNPGGHFTDSSQRIVHGIKWIST